MYTLNDVYWNIRNQILRDYPLIDSDELKAMMVFGLTEEAGEVAGIFKRVIRNFERDQDRIAPEELMSELGDVLWYLTGVCYASGFTLNDIYKYNIKKLEERYGR